MRHTLNVTILHVFLPALSFSLIATTHVDRNFAAVPVTAALATLIALAAGYAVYRFVESRGFASRPAIGGLILASAFGNVTYLGLPLITGMLGEQYGFVAILFDLLAATPILLTIGVFIATRYGSGKKISIASSIRRVLMLPPIWGMLAGIACAAARVPVPGIILDTTRFMGRAVVPVMIFTVGLALDFRDLKRLPVAVPALVLKLILGPVLAFGIGRLLGISGPVLKAVTLEGATPVMVISLIIADEFDLDVPLVAICIAVSTVASFFTLPAIMNMLF